MLSAIGWLWAAAHTARIEVYPREPIFISRRIEKRPNCPGSLARPRCPTDLRSTCREPKRFIGIGFNRPNVAQIARKTTRQGNVYCDLVGSRVGYENSPRQRGKCILGRRSIPAGLS